MTDPEDDIPVAGTVDDAPDDTLTQLARAAAEVEYEVRAVPISPHDRFVAKSADLFLACVAYAIVWLIWAALHAVIRMDRSTSLILTLCTLLAGIAIQAVVNAFNLGPEGSPGKRVAEYRIVVHTGEETTFLRRLTRYAFAHGLWLVFCVGLCVRLVIDDGRLDDWLDIALPTTMLAAFVQVIVSGVLVSYTHRALHDYLTGTMVATPQTKTVRPTRHAFRVIVGPRS